MELWAGWFNFDVNLLYLLIFELKNRSQKGAGFKRLKIINREIPPCWDEITSWV